MKYLSFITLLFILFYFSFKKINIERFDINKIPDLNKSNQKIIELINSNESFIISRLGGVESRITIDFLNNKKFNDNDLNALSNNAGIYNKNKDDLSPINQWCKKYNNCLKKSRYLSCFERLCANQQNFYTNKFKLERLSSKVLEPFYIINQNITPWTHYLLDKKILIINPFVNSFKVQIKNKFKMFKNKPIFLDNQKFLFYKTFQTHAGNHIHNNWLETFNIMCNDIKKLDFDIALLGCGGYGLPLCNFIKEDMNKSAIYIGGGLQLLFGVIGKRWENNDVIKKIIKENNCKFIHPIKEDILINNNRVEGGCYW
tara:strand:- start:2205 stop:3149 length:945 start_codon:yes stop_codon:yes gene_type:complete